MSVRLNQEVPVTPRADKTAAVLTVSSLDRNRDQLRGVLQQSQFRVVEAGSVREALRQVSRKRIFAIICDSDLPDGTFHKLLSETNGRAGSPLVIVTSANADEQLWGEVLNLGGYDVLAQPFDDVEIGRVTDAALRQWKLEAEPMPPASAKAVGAGQWAMPAISV